MQLHVSNSDCTQRDALHDACKDLLHEAVRHVRRHSYRAQQHDFAELVQVGHVALLEAASRNKNDATFKSFAWVAITGQIHRFVARMQLGPNHRTLEAEGVRASVITNVSQMGHLAPLTPPTGGDSHWVRDTVDHPPRSIVAMFASAGYAVSGAAQRKRLIRHVSEMVV